MFGLSCKEYNMKYAKDKSFAKKSKLKKELAAEEKKRLAIALEEQRVLQAEERRRKADELREQMERKKFAQLGRNGPKSSALEESARSSARREGAVDVLLKEWTLKKRKALKVEKVRRRKERRDARKLEKATAKARKAAEQKAAVEKWEAERKAAAEKTAAERKAAKDVRAMIVDAIKAEREPSIAASSSYSSEASSAASHVSAAFTGVSRDLSGLSSAGESSEATKASILAAAGVQRRSKRKRVEKKNRNDELGLSSKEFNAKYRKKQKEEQSKKNSVWSRLKALQTAMRDHIVAETFGFGLSLAGLNRQVLFVNLDRDDIMSESYSNLGRAKKIGGKKRKHLGAQGNGNAKRAKT
jgi:hypothetical protein